MQVNEYIIFTSNSGVSVRFDGVAYGLVTLEGLGDVEANIYQQFAPYQDGSNYLDAKLTPRHITIEFIARGDNYEQVKQRRSELGRVLNPKLGLGTLTYVSGSTVRLISGVAESVPYYPDGDSRGKRWQRGQVSFLCPNPYWRADTFTEEPTFEPLFQFPFEGEFEMGMQRDQRVIVNDGDAVAPLRIEFHGPAVNPIITNRTTGEFIRIKQTLREGERMIIDTADGNKSVYFVNENGDERNVFNWIDLDSSFFKLIVGENEIEYSADSDIQGATVNIEYSKLYTAV